MMISGSITRKVCARAWTAIGRNTKSRLLLPKMEFVMKVISSVFRRSRIMLILFTKPLRMALTFAGISFGARGITLNGILALQCDLDCTNVTLKQCIEGEDRVEIYSPRWHTQKRSQS